MSIVEKAMEKLERGEGEGEARTAASRRGPDGATAHPNTGGPLAELPDEEPSTGPLPALQSREPKEPAIAPAETLPARPGADFDSDTLRAAGLLPPEDCAAAMAEQYRRIKRPLLTSAFGRTRIDNGNLIMVGSALPGEGKTFTALNLALSIAHELDRTVLLVDADVAKPHITTALGLSDRPGLIDILLDEQLDLQQVLLDTGIKGLRFIPAGPRHRRSTELLASYRMESLLAEMADRYPDRVIVFDTPPLLSTTEAQVMSALMGQILIVVNSGVTPQKAVMAALESLDRSRPTSLVLNQTDGGWGDGYYGSYYGYE